MPCHAVPGAGSEARGAPGALRDQRDAGEYRCNMQCSESVAARHKFLHQLAINFWLIPIGVDQAVHFGKFCFRATNCVITHPTRIVETSGYFRNCALRQLLIGRSGRPYFLR